MQVTFDGNGPTGWHGQLQLVRGPVARRQHSVRIARHSPASSRSKISITAGSPPLTGTAQPATAAVPTTVREKPSTSKPSSDTGGGYDVGNTQPGDWLNYTVNIASASTYTFNARVANGVGGGVFHLLIDGRRLTDNISVPETGGYQTWQTLSIPGVRLPQGQHVLQLVMDSGGFYNAVGNFNWFSFN